MNFPFVSRSRFEAAQESIAWGQRQMRILEDKLTAQVDAARELLAAKDRQIEAERKEQHILLDRIAQLSGQPPIYEKPAIPVTPPPTDLPKVQPVVRIDDIHIAARQAMKDGTFNLPKGKA